MHSTRRTLAVYLLLGGASTALLWVAFASIDSKILEDGDRQPASARPMEASSQPPLVGARTDLLIADRREEVNPVGTPDKATPSQVRPARDDATDRRVGADEAGSGSELPALDEGTRTLFVPSGTKDHPRLRLEREDRDSKWADAIEPEIRNRIATMESNLGAAYHSMACRSTVCELQLTEAVETIGMNELRLASLRQAFPISQFSRIDSFSFPDGKGGQRIIVYGLRKNQDN